MDFLPNIGGVSNYLLNLCRQMPPKQIVVFAPVKKNISLSDKKEKFKIIRQEFFCHWPIWPKWLFLYWQLKKIIKQEKIDLLWAGQTLPIGTICYWLSKRLKIPYWIFSYGLDLTLPQKFGGRKLNLMKKVIKLAEKLITISQFTKNELVKLGEEENKIIIVYPCPHIASYKFFIAQSEIDFLKEKYQLQDKKIILSVGRLIKRKGFDQIIKSLPKIIKSISNVIYIIIGQGNYRSQLELLVKKLNLTSNVIFIGKIRDQELAAWYKLCHLFIMVPKQLENGDVEGFGIVYLEANSFKKPVIGSQSGGVPESVADQISGLLINNPENHQEIAEKIIQLLTNQRLAYKLGQQGYYRVLNEFIWSKQVKKIEPYLNE